MGVYALNDIVFIALSAAEVILLIAVIIILLITRKNSGADSARIEDIEDKVNNFSSRIDTEFERSRREFAAGQNAVRTELGAKLERQNTENTERITKLEGEIKNTLSEIKVENLEQTVKQGKALAEAVEKMRESNEKKLEQMRMTVDEKLTATFTTRLDSSFKTVSERLESVNKSLGEMKELSTGVTANVTALNRVLTNVKARGTWAEVQLGGILDQTIPGMYETNFVCVPGTQDRVEFAVRLPSNDGRITYLPIDSKFPMEDYIKVCEAADAADAEGVRAARKALETRVLAEARDISKYINEPLTTPYAIMYLATEGLYAEIASSRNGIAERVRTDFNIMIAGPSTVTALLSSLSYGYRAVAINEKANEVRRLLAAAKQQYEKFGDVLQKAKKKIDEAGSALEEADKRHNIIRRKLGNVDSLDEGETGSLPLTTGESGQ
ncbi:MAG: DNA recombination protein RmuC [Clostridia bacterium]|nr:DNA recombination protein RmuC [Clostridia bacterium]